MKGLRTDSIQRRIGLPAPAGGQANPFRRNPHANLKRHVMPKNL
jgi:hypothetical protein